MGRPDIDDAVVELVRGRDDIGGDRGGADLRDHFRLGRVIVEDGYPLARCIGQGVDGSVVNEHIGATSRGQAENDVFATHHLVGRLGAGHDLQQDSHMLVAGYAADGINGTGVFVELTTA